MKNQYFGDVQRLPQIRPPDASLPLRAAFALGLCRLLTADHDRTDCEFRQYLHQPGRWRHHDAELYDRLRCLLAPGTERSVVHARNWDLVPGATYFEAFLPDETLARQQYFTAAWEELADCDLIFFDPDNGIEVESTTIGARGSCKCIYWCELIHAYGMCKSLLVYQHYPRVSRERFVPFLASRLAEELGAPSVTAFRTPHVVFFLVAQDRHREALPSVQGTIAAHWPRRSIRGHEVMVRQPNHRMRRTVFSRG